MVLGFRELALTERRPWRGGPDIQGGKSGAGHMFQSSQPAREQNVAGEEECGVAVV